MSRKFAIPTYWEYFENQTYDNLGYHEISQIVPNFRYIDKPQFLQKFRYPNLISQVLMVGQFYIDVYNTCNFQRSNFVKIL